MNARWRWLGLGVGVVIAACSTGTEKDTSPAADAVDTDGGRAAGDVALEGDAAACSAPGVTPVGVSFVNHRASPVTLYWVDGRCTEIEMGTLAAGRAAGLGTFVGHHFRVRDGAKAPSGAIVREWTAQASDAPQATVVIDPPAGQTPVLCSTGGTVAANLHVVNQRAEDLSLFWVDGECKEIFKGTIGKGQSGGESSFVGHVFRVRTGTAEAPGALVREIVVSANVASDAGSDAATSGSTDVVLAPEDGGAPTICSGPGTTPLTLTVTNERTTPIALYWLDGQCAPALKETIAQGKSASESTFAGHVFAIRDGAQGAVLQTIVLSSGDAPTRTVNVP